MRTARSVEQGSKATGAVLAQATANISDAIGPSLPFLRRYARALTGSQELGDEWVRVCVEVLLQEPQSIPGSDAKLGVFTLFHRLRQPFQELEDTEVTEADAPGRLKERLGEMPVVQRQMLLLTVLEGFSVEQAAQILAIDIGAAEKALGEARNELKRVASVKVLVIEDEAVIALDVAKIVRNAGHQVVGIAATEKTALELARKHEPHLVLADIQLKGNDNGIAAVREIMKVLQIPVIFVTGYPERLLTGSGVEPAFVITKPFDSDLLRTAIAQALNTVTI